jgi:hypothetical protein
MTIIEQFNDIVTKIQKTASNNMKIALVTVTAIIQNAVDKNFNARGRTNGTADLFGGGSSRWKPLAPSYVKTLIKKGITPLEPTLERTGKLKQGIRIRPVGLAVVLSVDSRVDYAEENNEKRPFFQLSPDDIEDIFDYLQRTILEMPT